MKMDLKLVAAKDKKELARVAKKFGILQSIVKKIMLIKGKNGKPARSRKVIYAGLIEAGFYPIKK
jgi:hypothetical protein